jgi:hypothetical protein
MRTSANIGTRQRARTHISDAVHQFNSRQDVSVDSRTIAMSRSVPLGLALSQPAPCNRMSAFPLIATKSLRRGGPPLCADFVAKGR